jgi:hypothetical protein
MSPCAVEAASEAPGDAAREPQDTFVATVELVDVDGTDAAVLEVGAPPLEPHPASGMAIPRATSASSDERRWWIRTARSITGPDCTVRAEKLLNGPVRNRSCSEDRRGR